MDNASYATLLRQSGLRQEMQVIANNIANVGTDGFRKEGVVFSEFVSRQENRDVSLSMAMASGRIVDRSQGQLTQTGGAYDFAIEGEGYFLVQTPEGERLTRAGRFFPNAEGDLMTADGARLLDAGRAPVFVPPDAASVTLATDGTLSADGQPLAQVGLFAPEDPNDMAREAGVRFRTDSGVAPVAEPTLVQGFLEASNVDPVLEVARMIEVQRAYESGRSLLQNEHDRIQNVIKTLGQ
jgi:flagellar basal-body rod protein FlgF